MATSSPSAAVRQSEAATLTLGKALFDQNLKALGFLFIYMDRLDAAQSHESSQKAARII
jgi:hypothetical protein